MMPGRPWNMGEIAFLRKHYGSQSPDPMSVSAIAHHLGRTDDSVVTQARNFDLSRHRPKIDLADLRRLHAQGLNDIEIGQRLGCSDGTVYRLRKELGLPSLFRRPARPDWLQGEGLSSLAELQALAGRIEAARHWPDCDCTRAEADCLDAVCQVGGRAIRRDIMSITDWSHSTTCYYLRRLLARGLLRQAGTRPTRTLPSPVYVLAGTAREVAAMRTVQMKDVAV